LNAAHTHESRVNNVDKNPAYLPAIEQLQEEEHIPEGKKTRQVKYLNNIVEKDHRGIKSLINPGMGFGSFNAARRTLKGYEAMNIIRKSQIKNVDKGDVIGQIYFINKIFGLAA